MAFTRIHIIMIVTVIMVIAVIGIVIAMRKSPKSQPHPPSDPGKGIKFPSGDIPDGVYVMKFEDSGIKYPFYAPWRNPTEEPKLQFDSAPFVHGDHLVHPAPIMEWEYMHNDDAKAYSIALVIDKSKRLYLNRTPSTSQDNNCGGVELTYKPDNKFIWTVKRLDPAFGEPADVTKIVIKFKDQDNELGDITCSLALDNNEFILSDDETVIRVEKVAFVNTPADPLFSPGDLPGEKVFSIQSNLPESKYISVQSDRETLVLNRTGVEDGMPNECTIDTACTDTNPNLALTSSFSIQHDRLNGGYTIQIGSDIMNSIKYMTLKPPPDPDPDPSSGSGFGSTSDWGAMLAVTDDPTQAVRLQFTKVPGTSDVYKITYKNLYLTAEVVCKKPKDDGETRNCTANNAHDICLDGKEVTSTGLNPCESGLKFKNATNRADQTWTIRQNSFVCDDTRKGCKIKEGSGDHDTLAKCLDACIPLADGSGNCEALHKTNTGSWFDSDNNAVDVGVKNSVGECAAACEFKNENGACGYKSNKKCFFRSGENTITSTGSHKDDRASLCTSNTQTAGWVRIPNRIHKPAINEPHAPLTGPGEASVGCTYTADIMQAKRLCAASKGCNAFFRFRNGRTCFKEGNSCSDYQDDTNMEVRAGVDGDSYAMLSDSVRCPSPDDP